MRPRSSTTWSMLRSVRQRLMARPAWPAPMTRVSVVGTGISWGGRGAAGSRRRRVAGRGAALGGTRSAGVDLDGHRHAVGHDVEHGRACAGLLDHLAQLLGVVAPDLEADRDLLVAVA